MCVKGVITLEKICAMPKIIILSREDRTGPPQGRARCIQEGGGRNYPGSVVRYDILGENILKAVTGIDNCQRQLFSSTGYDF